jgi:hypothetical protein
MKLRSGKTIGNDASAYNYYKENITLSRDGFSSQDKLGFPQIYYVSEQERLLLQKQKWLIKMLQRYIYEISMICPTISTVELAVCERARLISEMVYIILEEIDFIADSPVFNNIITNLIARFYSMKNEITDCLICGCYQFSVEDRQFLGNLRADLVKVAVLLENRQK